MKKWHKEPLLHFCTLVSALVVSLRKYWARIAVQVAGSWITAIGLLMLGWTYRGMG